MTDEDRLAAAVHRALKESTTIRQIGRQVADVHEEVFTGRDGRDPMVVRLALLERSAKSGHPPPPPSPEAATPDRAMLAKLVGVVVALAGAVVALARTAGL